MQVVEFCLDAELSVLVGCFLELFDEFVDLCYFFLVLCFF